MKKFLVYTFIVSFLFLISPVTISGKSASAGINSDLLKLIPHDFTGIMSVGFKKLSSTGFFNDIIMQTKEKTSKKDFDLSYDEFVAKTGIDLKKDIKSVVIGMNDLKPVVLINLNYNKKKVLAFIKEKHSKKLITKKYAGKTFYIEGKETECMVFINEKIIGAGDFNSLKKVIDLYAGQGKSILNNNKFKSYLKKFDPSKMVSFVFLLPKTIKKAHNTPMMQADLSKAEAINGYIDYSNAAIKGKLAMICPNEKGNKSLVTSLNEMKGMAQMFGPEFGELVNKFTFTANSNNITLTFSITDELISKLSKKIKESFDSKSAPNTLEK